MAQVSPENFVEQMTVLRESAEIVSVAEIAENVRRRRSPGRRVAITFDDGYASLLRDALPALTSSSFPAAVFVATEFVATQQPFFWDEIGELVTHLRRHEGPLELVVSGHRRLWMLSGEDERRHATAVLQRLIQSLSLEERAAALDQLRDQAGRTALRSGDRPMTPDELKRLAASPGIEVGSHTRHHTSLRFQTPTTQARELSEAAEHLAGWLGDGERGFAYPFGVPGVDFDDTTKTLVRAQSHRYALANAPGLVGPSSDPYALPRLAVPDLSGGRFAKWLADNF